MLKDNEVKEILDNIKLMYPFAGCELNYHNNFELLICVLLSAQTTDKKVNSVTPTLFSLYPDALALSKADVSIVEQILKPLGLAATKAKNIIQLSNILINDLNNIIPSSMDELTSLPGVGRKTANVVRALGFNIPSLPVDTHVYRVSIRLGIAKEGQTVLAVEETLKSLIKEEDWIMAHHLLLFFGRYFCKAVKPYCDSCFYKDKCKKNNMQ